MAVVSVYQHGIKAGVAPGPSDHKRAKRKAVSGWSAKSTRSNLDFLRSVQIENLDGQGFCITLTVKTCPATAKIWEGMRDAYVKRLKRAGMTRLHWVTEWQRRGVPHLHGMVYFPEVGSELELIDRLNLLEDAWVDVCQVLDADSLSQHVVPIGDQVGWLEYLAKHAARGVNHYQRSGESMPVGWKGLSGRVWGKSGDWPVGEPAVFEMQNAGFWRLRRAVRGYRLADARASKGKVRLRRIVSARSCLKCHNRNLSSVRGVSEWAPASVNLCLVDWVSSMGYAVFC